MPNQDSGPFQPMSADDLEKNLLPPQARKQKTDAGLASKAATKARKKATKAADQTTAAAKTVAETKRSTKKVLSEVETAGSRSKVTQAATSADKEAKSAAKAAAAAVEFATRAAKLARESEVAASAARKKGAAAIKACARARGAEIEAAQAERNKDLSSKVRKTIENRVTKLKQLAKKAEADAATAATDVAAMAARAKSDADAAAAKAEVTAKAVKKTADAAAKAEEKAKATRPATKETVSATTVAAGRARSQTQDAVDKTRASAFAAAASKAEADRAAKRAAAAAAKAARAQAETGADLKAPELYLNRELTWLNFNKRVLYEAESRRNPLLERVKFLAIVGSNIDEFFMKRIGGLKQQVGAGVHDLTVDGRSPEQQIHDSVHLVREIQERVRQVYRELLEELRDNDIVISNCDELSPEELAGVRAYYLENIFPLVTPLAMDPAHPFPHISNLSLNLLVTLRTPEETTPMMARVKVPTGNTVPRFIRVGERNHFVPLEDVMANNLDVLFPEVEVLDCEVFRVTRNANTERDEETADDLLEMIETEVRDRRFAPIVRLETSDTIEPSHRGMLAAELGLDETEDVFESDVMLARRDLMEIAGLDLPHLHDPDHHPIDNVDLDDTQNIFHIIRNKGPILLHHPYESFNTSVVRFVREACRDPKVMAIKMTLYRTTEGTGIVDYLIEAARNGKQVAVSVELKARFDESANIEWAGRLEEAGIHVTYGVVGLKTHSKLVLVIRRDFNGLRRYAHIGTGNYHAGTARLYADFSMLTCDNEIGSDLIDFFNFLTSGCQPMRRYSKILVSPRNMKNQLLAKIDREISKHSSRSPGLIRLKTNALEDPDITEALYRASRADVKVELIVRDTCRIRPRTPGLSDNITAISVVGRFLEHTRLFYFRNGGEEEFFIGSADLMMRNLESRAEVAVAVEDERLREELRNFLEVQLTDTHDVWEMLPDGTYVHREPKDAEGERQGCQQAMIDAAESRHQEVRKMELRRPKAIARGSKRT